MTVGIIGYGHVGTAMNQLFPDAIIYDEPKGIGNKTEINRCNIAFICVPTPMGEDGQCDTSVVCNVLEWVECETIVIRSTVPVGFTENQVRRLNKQIVFQPEYYGETNNHPFADLSNRGWITLGGSTQAIEAVVRLYQQVYTSELIINAVDSRTAELAKYMENCFLATKVVFCNEFYDIAQAFGVDYTKLRETWLLDPRIGRSHSFVYPQNRGFGGACLPKDIAAMIFQADNESTDVTLLKAVVKKNELYTM